MASETARHWNSKAGVMTPTRDPAYQTDPMRVYCGHCDFQFAGTAQECREAFKDHACLKTGVAA